MNIISAIAPSHADHDMLPVWLATALEATGDLAYET